MKIPQDHRVRNPTDVSIEGPSKLKLARATGTVAPKHETECGGRVHLTEPAVEVAADAGDEEDVSSIHDMQESVGQSVSQSMSSSQVEISIENAASIRRETALRRMQDVLVPGPKCWDQGKRWHTEPWTTKHQQNTRTAISIHTQFRLVSALRNVWCHWRRRARA
jgi:hypothetical protein